MVLLLIAILQQYSPYLHLMELGIYSLNLRMYYSPSLMIDKSAVRGRESD